MSDDSGFCKGGWNPICWPLVVLAPLALLSGCDSEGGGSDNDYDAGDGGDAGVRANDAGAYVAPQGYWHPDACQIPALTDAQIASGQTEEANRFNDVYITDTPSKNNECLNIKDALGVVKHEKGNLHFNAGQTYKGTSIIASDFKSIKLMTGKPEDYSADKKPAPAVLVPDNDNADAGPVLTFENPSLSSIQNIVVDGLQQADGIIVKGDFKDKLEYKEQSNLALNDIQIRDTVNGLAVQGPARIKANGLEISHPNRAVTLAAGSEGEFKKLTIRDSADPSDDHLFVADNAARLSLEEVLVSNTSSYDSVFSIKTDFLQFYGAVFMNNQTQGSILDLDLGKLANPQEDQQHLVSSILTVNNDANESIVKLRSQDIVTLLNFGVHGNYGIFNNIIDAFDPAQSESNKGPKYIINTSITDNTPFDGVLKSDVISGADISSQNGGVVVDGSNIYNNGLENQSYGPNNISVEHCDKGDGYIMSFAKDILKPDAFDLIDGTHEACALINGGANHGFYSNNADDSIGHVGAYGGWKEYVLKAIEKTISGLYK